MLRGVLAAAVTPLRDGGEALDDDAFAPYVDFLVAADLDGIFVLGTTGEGILLTGAERRRAARLYVQAAAGRVAVAIHCGAQTTAATVALAADAVELGADAVAVVGPPYFALDEPALLAHFVAAARACAPLPFYVYEFAARSGYAVPLAVIERLRDQVDNLAGLKVSDAPWERLEPYLIDGLDVFVGPEALIARGLAHGTTGAVSGLASAFPAEVAALVRSPSEEASERVAGLRRALERFPFHAAAKRVLGHRGLPVREDVRAPLRTLTDDERREVEALL